MKKWIGWVSAGVLLAGLWSITFWARAVPVAEVCAAEWAEMPVGFTCTGKIEEINPVTVTSDIPVVARNVYVQVGETVQKGDLLADIDLSKTVALLQETYGSVLADSAGTALPDGLLQSAAIGANLIPRQYTAPVSGIVTQIGLEPNSLSKVGDSLFVLSGNGTKRARLHIPESEISAVTPGLRVVLTGAGLPHRYTGSVTKIAPSATVEDGVSGVDVWVSVPDSDESFRSGLHVSAEIETAAPAASLWLPEACVGIDDTGAEYVLILENGIVRKRTVETASISGTRCQIRSGMDVGEWVLLDRTCPVGRRIRPQIVKGETVE